MRVIAGQAKGRRLKGVPGREVRPTADRVREALFSILGSRFDLCGARLLDLFAGTGALGIEALSRGADFVVFVEQSKRAAAILRENLANCGFQGRSRVLVLPASRAIRVLASRGEKVDGAFVDPPYQRGLTQETLSLLGISGIMADSGWVMTEHHCDERIAQRYHRLELTQTRRYGKTALALFRMGSREAMGSS